MSSSEEDSYSMIFASLKHPIRRKILRILSSEAQTFSDLQKQFKIESSHLTYHIDGLGNLLYKTEDGKYALSSLGEAAMSTMTKVEDIPTTAPHQSRKTRPKKIFGRSVAIALGIICILSIASLGGTLAYYTMTIHNKENELASAHNTINQLNTNVTNLQNQNKQLQTWLSGNLTLLDQTKTWLNGNVTTYNEAQNELRFQVRSNHVVSENSTVWVNNETYPRHENNETIYSIPAWEFWGPYAGSVSILFSSNSTPTRVEVSSYFLNGSNNLLYLFDGGSIGWYYFPVSPSTTYLISLYNPLGKPSDFTVTITYYY